MYVIPAPGLLIPDPEQRGTPGYHLPPEGREVAVSDYWHRRLRDGDVTQGAPPAPPAPTGLDWVEVIEQRRAEQVAMDPAQ